MFWPGLASCYYAKTTLKWYDDNDVRSQPNVKKSFESWEESDLPFGRVHIDFFKLIGKDFFILVESHTKWIEVRLMKRTQAVDVIEILDEIQANFGLFGTLVCDNGPPFSSSAFEKAMKKDGIILLHSPPYTPESNGLVERGVSTVKKVLKKEFSESATITEIKSGINKFHFKYRNTPTTTTGRTPSDMLFKFTPTTFLNLIIPKHQHYKEKNAEKKYEAPKVFVEGEKVLVKLRRDQEKMYQTKILKSIGKNTFLVDINDNVKLVHNNQLRKSWLQDEKSHKVGTEIENKDPLNPLSYQTPQEEPEITIRNEEVMTKEKCPAPIVLVENKETINEAVRRYPSRVRKGVEKLNL